MKRKTGFTATPMPKNWVRALYIFWERKLRKIDSDLLIAFVAVVILILQMFIIVTAVNAQQRPKVAPHFKIPDGGLKIGDKLPPEVWSISLPAVNHPEGETTISLDDYKGKLIILDFWATWCAACIQTFPKIEKIQMKFPGKVNFVGVTYEGAVKAADFFEAKRTQAISYPFPSLVQDTLFRKLFPHRGIPHYVWIDPAGVVRAITTQEQITLENIQAIFRKDEKTIPLKRDINADRPLFLSDVIELDDLSSYSVLTRAKYDGLPSGSRFRTSGTTIRGRAVTNSPLLMMYQIAVRPIFEELGDAFNSKRMVLNLSEPVKTNNLYNYELIVPVEQARHLYRYMLEDLNRYTGYYGEIEKREVKCLALVRTTDTDGLHTKGGKSENSLFYRKPARLTNFPLSHLIMRLNGLQKIDLPIIDETGFADNVDLEFSGNTDLETIRTELKRYGLDLVETRRSLDMFVLRDKSKMNGEATHRFANP